MAILLQTEMSIPWGFGKDDLSKTLVLPDYLLQPLKTVQSCIKQLEVCVQLFTVCTYIVVRAVQGSWLLIR